jgi:hypothetical protein
MEQPESSSSRAQPPLYLIIKGSMIPPSSKEFAELERLKREADVLEINDFVGADTLFTLLPRVRPIRVCGGSRWISVHAQFMELRRVGYDASIYEPASYVLDYDGA